MKVVPLEGLDGTLGCLVSMRAEREWHSRPVTPVDSFAVVSKSVLPPVRIPFRAIAVTVVPEAARLGEAEWAELDAIVEAQLAPRPARLRAQLVLLVRLLDLLPVLRWGRRFRALDEARRVRVLEAVQYAPLLLLRRGFWGLRTLVLMGWYARPEAAAAIGWRPHPRGWLARRPAAARQPHAIPRAAPDARRDPPR